MADRLNNLEYGDLPGIEFWKWKEPSEMVYALIDQKSTIGHQLARVVLAHIRWDRLKRCSVCQKWFVDAARSERTERCSRTCTDRWWSRAR